MLALNVPYVEKDKAKALGAKWNPKEKVWMAPGDSFEEYAKFNQWIDGTIIIPKEMYIVEARRRCWKCGQETPVICFAVKDYIEVPSGNQIHVWKLTRIFSKMPEELLEYVKSHYNFKLKYSNTVKDKYFANCCITCNSLQGNNFLFNEPLESPLYINSEIRARAVTLYKVCLPFALSVDTLEEFPIVIGYGGVSEPEMSKLIDMYSNFREIKLF